MACHTSHRDLCLTWPHLILVGIIWPPSHTLRLHLWCKVTSLLPFSESVLQPWECLACLKRDIFLETGLESNEARVQHAKQDKRYTFQYLWSHQLCSVLYPAEFRVLFCVFHFWTITFSIYPWRFWELYFKKQCFWALLFCIISIGTSSLISSLAGFGSLAGCWGRQQEMLNWF